MTKKVLPTSVSDNVLKPKTTTNIEVDKSKLASPRSLTNRSTNTFAQTTSNVLPNDSSYNINIGDNCFSFCSDQNLIVNITENIAEQKYIKNIEGAGALCAGTINSSNVYTNIVNNVCKLGFDTDSGFEVTDLGSGLAKIGMNSTFKYWEVNGSSGLVACGLDTVNFVAGSGVTITSNNSAVPKTLTISAAGSSGVASLNSLTGALTLSAGTNTAIGVSGNTLTLCNTYTGVTGINSLVGGVTLSAGTNVTIGSSGNTLTLCSASTPPGGCNTQIQYNNSGAFAGSCGLTYDSATCSVGMSKIAAPLNQGLQISVSDTNTYWYSLYGDFTANAQDDYASQVVYDSQGNIYIIGADGNTGTPHLVKYNPNGTILWQKLFTEVTNDYKTGDAVAVDSNDNVYCIVGTDGTINDITIFKITSAGDIIWQTSLTDPASTFDPYIAGIDLIIDNSGNVFASVYYDIGINHQAVIKLNSSGVVQWQKVLTGGINGYPQGIALDNSNNVIMLGGYNNPSYNSSALVVKYDTSGTLLWQKIISHGTSGQSVYAGQITTDSSGNIYIVGSRSDNSGDFVLKLDNSGNLIWQTNINIDSSAGYSSSSYYGVSLDTSGNVYVGGYGTVYGAMGNSDLQVIKLNSSGVLQWQRAFSGNNSDYQYYYWGAKSIDVFNNSFVLTGYTYSSNPATPLNDSEALTVQLPTDGSLTGTYGNFTYLETTFTTDNTPFVITVGSETESTGILASSSGVYTLVNGSNTNTYYKIAGGTNSTSIGTDGRMGNSYYTFPLNNGQPNQVLTSNSSGDVSWCYAQTYLDFNCTLTVTSRTQPHAAKGTNNIAIGRDTLYCSYNGGNNVAMGVEALKLNSNGGNNVAMGYQALYCNTTYGNNLGIGFYALRNNTTGYSNVAIGYGSQSNNNGGRMNIGIGYDTLKNVCNSDDNIALGGCSQFSRVSGNNNISLGLCSLKNQTTGAGNVAIGPFALGNSLSSCWSIAIGEQALRNNNGNQNIAIGDSALYGNTTGEGLVAIGTNALRCNSIGCQNTAIGASSLLWNTTGAYNVGVGASSLRFNTNGNYNIAIGGDSLTLNTSGSANAAIGVQSLSSNTYGSFNVGLGRLALFNNTTGCSNVAIGFRAAESNKTGNNNVTIGAFAGFLNCSSYIVAIGASTLSNNTTGTDNIAIGDSALNSNTTGIKNTAIGTGAMLCNTIGSCNMAIGTNALKWCTSGCANVAIGVSALEFNRCSWNVAIGNSALYQNITGEFNIAIGANALENNTIGFRNVAIGRSSLLFNTCGGENMSIGFASLYNNTTGSFNTAIGGFSMYGNTTGCRNTAIGLAALRSTRNNENVAIGFNTLFNTLGGCNTAIGASAGYGMTNGCNNTLIGWSASAQTVTSCNTITLGNSSISCIRAQVTTISALSDQRDKTNVVDLPLGLQFILDLRPVKFTWNMRDGGKVGTDDTGFIAQEVLSVEDKYNVSQYLDMVGRENPEKLEVKPGKLIPILVKAIQELSDKVDLLESKLAQSLSKDKY